MSAHVHAEDRHRREDLAVEAANAAARAAGVNIRELVDVNELRAIHRLFVSIWRPDPTNPPVTTDLLRSLAKVGNYVVGAFENDNLVAACVGFFGAPADGAVHSHIAGVSPRLRGRSVGFALKVHQRAWAMRRGASTISWTFDPLVSRNANFNVTKLAAAPVEYLPNFYGRMSDGINGADDSDRLLVRWELEAAEVCAACVGKPARVDAAAERARGAASALSTSETGWPVTGSTDAPTVLVCVPHDIEMLRASEPRQARAWRVAVRDVLGGLMAAGARVTGFDREGCYVVTTDGRALTNPNVGKTT